MKVDLLQHHNFTHGRTPTNFALNGQKKLFSLEQYVPIGSAALAPSHRPWPGGSCESDEVEILASKFKTALGEDKSDYRLADEEVRIILWLEDGWHYEKGTRKAKAKPNLPA